MCPECSIFTSAISRSMDKYSMNIDLNNYNCCFKTLVFFKSFMLLRLGKGVKYHWFSYAVIVGLHVLLCVWIYYVCKKHSYLQMNLLYWRFQYLFLCFKWKDWAKSCLHIRLKIAKVSRSPGRDPHPQATPCKLMLTLMGVFSIWYSINILYCSFVC